MHTIPSLDFKQFSEGTETQRLQFAKDLGAAYTDIGFVTIQNHGFSEEDQENLYKIVQEFYALPTAVKAKYEIDGLAGQRGYTSYGREHAKGMTAADLKEFWQVGQPSPAYSGPEYPDNVSVDEVPAFAPTCVDVYQKLEAIGAQMLQAIALYLELDEDYFKPWITGGNSILRAIHYPPITTEPEPGAVRAGQHEDINLITLLMGASAQGLEVLNKQGEWVGITAIPGALVVNVGDMLQRLTNGVLRSTTHRVQNPPRELWHTPRFSIPFFLHPTGNMPLDCLPSTVTEDRPLAFEPITAGGYLQERLREIGLM